jgi:fibronectin type 3 domain-containing protein
VSLHWTAAPGASSYNIYLGTSPGGESATPVQTGVSGTSTVVTGLSSSSDYYFKVAGVNSHGVGPLSAEARAIPVPPAPTNLKVTSVSSGTASLSWNAAQDASSYNVYKGVIPGKESATPWRMGVTDTSITLADLANSGSYYFKVAAVNVSGTGPQSNEARAIMPPTPAPTGLSAVVGGTEVNLSWTAARGSCSFNVYQGESSGGESSTPVQSGILRGSTTVKGLSANHRYFFKVAGVCNGVVGPLSSEVSALTAPDAPASLGATPAPGQVTLNWTAATGAASYDVYRGVTSGGESSVGRITGITGTSTTVRGLADSGNYFFQVSSVNSSGAEGARSPEAHALTPTAPAPANLSATPGTGQVSLSWTASPGACSYDVYQGSASGKELATPVQSGVPRNSAVITKLSAGSTYFFQVAGACNGTVGPRSNEASAKVN